MHILLITEFFPRIDSPVFSGGVETRVFYVARSLAKNHTVTVLARRKKGEVSHEEHKLITVKRFGSPVETTDATISSLFNRLFYILWCIKESLRIPFDVVEGSNYVTFLPAFFIGLLHRRPKIAYYPDILIGRWRKLFGVVLGIIGEVGERIFISLPWDKVIATSEAEIERLLAAGMNKEKIQLIPCGVECKALDKPDDENKKDQLIVVSRLVGYKRVDWAVKLVKELSKEFSGIHLVIVGSGPELSALKQLADDLEICDRIEFKSNVNQEDLISLISQSLLLIHPSLIEGFGIVLVEAAALGTPFVAADIPTSVELKKRLKAGVTFNHDKFEALVNEVACLLKHRKDIEKMRLEGLKNVQLYDWERISASTANLYQSTLRKNL